MYVYIHVNFVLMVVENADFCGTRDWNFEMKWRLFRFLSWSKMAFGSAILGLGGRVVGI